MSVTTKKKHVERELFEDFSLPEDHQSIVRVVRPRGNNLHQVATPSGEEYIASMPPKFRKHVWIKRGDYVVTEPIPEGNKVRAEIVRILMKDHIRYITQNNKWPSEFTEQEDCESKELSVVSNKLQRIKVSSENISESDSESEEEDNLLMENPNRPPVYFEESESSEYDSESESDSEEKEKEEKNSKDKENESNLEF